MVGECLIVEDQILQSAFLNGLQHKPVGAVDRRDHLHRPVLQFDRLRRTVPCTDAATKADFPVNLRMFLRLRAVRIFPGFLHGNSKNRTDLCAFSATDTRFQRYLRNIVGRCHRLHGTELSGRLQRLAAASAAVADKGRMLPYIFPDLHQVAVIGTLQHILRLFSGDQPCVFPMLRQRTRHIVKSQTNIPGSIDLAGISRMICLVAAVAGSKTNILCLLYNMCRAFIVQNMVCLIIGQHRLLHKHPSKPGLRGKKEILDEILLHVHILPVQFAQVFLVDIPSGPHEGKFDKACHGRRHDELPLSFIFRIHQKRFFTEMVQKFLRLCFRGSPDLCRPLQGKGTHRKPRHPFCFLFCIQYLQDLIQRLRWRRSLSEPVDPLLQILVGVPCCQMSHAVVLLSSLSCIYTHER